MVRAVRALVLQAPELLELARAGDQGLGDREVTAAGFRLDGREGGGLDEAVCGVRPASGSGEHEAQVLLAGLPAVGV